MKNHQMKRMGKQKLLTKKRMILTSLLNLNLKLMTSESEIYLDLMILLLPLNSQLKLQEEETYWVT